MRSLFPLLLLAPLGALARPAPSSITQSAPVTSLYQFPSDQHLENLAARSNGHLLLTVVSKPFLYDVDPASPSPTLLHEFSNSTSVCGIVEIALDVFAVVVGNSSSTTLVGVKGSFSVWSVDMTTPEPTIRLVTAIPGGETLDGITTVDGQYSNVVLIADCTLGAVWRVDILTGAHSIAVQNPAFDKNSTSSRGINGVHFRDGQLYFTNSATRSYGRIATGADGSAAGEVEILATSKGQYDDFAFDAGGNAWIATHPGSLNEVGRAGGQSNFTSAALDNPTAVKFGRGSVGEASTLYMVTYGEPTVGGQLLAVDTSLGLGHGGD